MLAAMSMRPAIAWRRLVVTFGRPENLAVFRIAVAAALLLAPDLYDAPRWAALPPELRAAPTAMERALEWIPVTPRLASIAFAFALAGGVASLVGLYARAALTVTTLAALYLLGIPQRFGPVTHNHHLVWFLALLAASPSADALSIDALRRRAHPSRAALAYALPLFAAWLLVAIVFFFPGLWKLRLSGSAWITGDNLRNQLYWKWAQAGGFSPALRVDRLPWLCRLGALLVVVFELGFGLLLPWRSLRPFAVACAWLFHLATAALMNVSFFSLALCYVMFFDWRGPLASLRARLGAHLDGVAANPRGRRLASRSALPPLVAGALLVSANAIWGARGIVNDWPFACYPTFQTTAGTEMPALVVRAVRADGSEVTLPAAPLATGQRQRLWALGWSLMPRGADPARFAGYWRALEGRDGVRQLAAGARSIRFYRAWISVLPEDAGRPPRREELLHELSL
jgi:Vitamin K-dependent gamma-carboxylase